MDNALSIIQGWIKSSTYKVVIIPRTGHEYDCNEVLGITEHSVLGSIINSVGGISIYNNLIRHYGGENKYSLSIRLVNQIKNGMPSLIKGQLIIADDIYGGLFSINSNPQQGKIGNIMYLPPDSYVWESLDIGHSAFVKWSLTGDLDLFYKTIREKISTSGIICNFIETFSFSPPLWVKANAHKCSKIQSTNSIQIRGQMISQLYDHE